MEETIRYHGAAVGQVRIEEAGLYWHLDARCECPADGVLRLYGVEGFRSEPFGVFVPEAGVLTLQKSVSRHSAPALPTRWLLGREAEGFRPWAGSVEGQEILDGMICPGADPDSVLLAVSAETEPVPLAEYASVMEPRRLDGRNYLALELRGGLPVLPEADETETPAEAPSISEQELDGAVVGAEDLLVDPGVGDPAPEPV